MIKLNANGLTTFAPDPALAGLPRGWTAPQIQDDGTVTVPLALLQAYLNAGFTVYVEQAS